jgi:polysaccharide biosynthesis/export protein
MNCVRWMVCLTAMSVLAGCSPHGGGAAGRVAATPGPSSSDTMAAAATSANTAAKTGANNEYVIGPGDQLSVFVYDSPQLSAEVPVRPDGRISTPLIQDIVAAGKTPTQLGSEMAEQLKAFVKEPHVTIILRSFIGPLDRQIRVIGEAAEPQAIAYRDKLTVLDVMIVTKGLTKYAAGNRAVIVRRGQDKDGADRQETIHVRLSDLMKDGDISQNIPVQPGDTLIIPQSWF